jgi:1D-myo-inositol-tetrakisphosphate 5-kinase/inositol-polyphosphate multikinase
MNKNKEFQKQARSPKKFNSELIIAGHGGIFREKNSKTILKKLQPPPKGSCEENYYKTISIDTSLKNLKLLCPKFHSVTYNDQNEAFLKLEDLTKPFKNPCIIDIKIGRVTWDPNATKEKRIKEESKYPPLKNLGFQLLGCRVGHPSGINLKTIKLDKTWGRSLNEENISDGLKLFLSSAGSSQRLELIKGQILTKLYAIQNWFLSQTRFRFYASSILILYDGISLEDIGSQGSSDSDDDPKKEMIPLVDVRMIDFAHVFDGEPNCLDENYLFGINNLIANFESI